MDKLVIVCGLNGGRRKEECPAVPYTPREIAAEARRAVEAGAAVVHIHARNPDGSAAYEAHTYDIIDSLVREECGDEVIINHSTARPPSVPFETVERYLRGTRQPVDMVSVNLGNLSHARPGDGGWIDGITPHGINDILRMLEVCYDAGTVPEPAILDYGMVNTAAWLAREGRLRNTGYFMIEFSEFAGLRPVQHMPASVRGYHFMMDLVEDLFPGSTKLAHGYHSSTFEIAMQAIASGDGLRIGLEDRPTMPDGSTVASSNADLVQWVVQTARAYGREPASPAEARGLLMG